MKEMNEPMLTDLTCVYAIKIIKIKHELFCVSLYM
jgi:hypothetical protein